MPDRREGWGGEGTGTRPTAQTRFHSISDPTLKGLASLSSYAQTKLHMLMQPLARFFLHRLPSLLLSLLFSPLRPLLLRKCFRFLSRAFPSHCLRTALLLSGWRCRAWSSFFSFLLFHACLQFSGFFLFQLERFSILFLFCSSIFQPDTCLCFPPFSCWQALRSLRSFLSLCLFPTLCVSLFLRASLYYLISLRITFVSSLLFVKSLGLSLQSLVSFLSFPFFFFSIIFFCEFLCLPYGIYCLFSTLHVTVFIEPPWGFFAPFSRSLSLVFA